LSLAGVVKATVADVLLPVAAASMGAPGTPAGTTGAEELEGELVPAGLEAVTVKV
jgi:hypothetical protein